MDDIKLKPSSLCHLVTKLFGGWQIDWVKFIVIVMVNGKLLLIEWDKNDDDDETTNRLMTSLPCQYHESVLGRIVRPSVVALLCLSYLHGDVLLSEDNVFRFFRYTNINKISAKNYTEAKFASKVDQNEVYFQTIKVNWSN